MKTTRGLSKRTSDWWLPAYYRCDCRQNKWDDTFLSRTDEHEPFIAEFAKSLRNVYLGNPVFVLCWWINRSGISCPNMAHNEWRHFVQTNERLFPYIPMLQRSWHWNAVWPHTVMGVAMIPWRTCDNSIWQMDSESNWYIFIFKLRIVFKIPSFTMYLCPNHYHSRVCQSKHTWHMVMAWMKWAYGSRHSQKAMVNYNNERKYAVNSWFS